ncbi:MAG: hypothetical protein EP330_25890 [Deltaproteobacteria bacterium]|nr:MAG: hypothetical protein EP330_25890 [Deltaproteobacteria bacterium]
MTRHFAGIALAVCLCAVPALAETPEPPPEMAATEDRSSWDAERWIAEVDARAASLAGLRYSAQRTTIRGDVTVEERWRFVLFGGDRFRIDYFGDTARQITCDGRWLVDYIPAMGKAVRWDLHQLDTAEKTTMLGKVLQKVGVPGLRLGQAEGVTWTLAHATRGDRPVVQLDGTGKDGSTLHYVIDEEHLGVHAIRIVQGNQTVLDAELSDHRTVDEHVSVPHVVTMESPDKGGLAKISVRLTKVSALTDSPDNLFTTTLDPSIPIEEYP